MTHHDKKYVIGIVISNTHVRKEDEYKTCPIYSSLSIFTDIAEQIILQESYLLAGKKDK